MNRHVDVAVVGGGIVGLAFAAEAVARNRSVVLFDRSPKAVGASVRNFGMVWPIGQPPGRCYDTAMRSRRRWLDWASRAGIWVNPCGSVHAAYQPDEWAVLQEFAARAEGVECEVVPAGIAIDRFPNLVPDGLLGVLYSPTELCVDPRQAIDRLTVCLAQHEQVDVLFRTAVTHIEGSTVRTAAGDVWTARQVFVCSGTDFETLFPREYAASGLRKCRLQMLRTGPQPNGWKLGPHVAGGLTLGHYSAFRVCPALAALKARFAADQPEYVLHGIHVMASQNQLGEVVIGDSHHYDDDISPFASERIDALILEKLFSFLRLPDRRIAQRWCGEYAKHPTKTFVTVEPQPNCHIISGVGGAGMTMSFGYAERWWDGYEAGRPFRHEE